MHLRLTKALVCFTLAQNNRFSLCSKWESSHRVIFIKTNKAVRSLGILSGELAGTKKLAENLFSLPICGIMRIMKKPLPLGEVAAKPTEGL